MTEQGQELTYEDVPAETPAGRVMPPAGGLSTANPPLENVYVSPLNGAVIVASADTAARARAGKAAKRELYRQYAEAGMLTAAQAVRHGVMTELEAWQHVVAAQTDLALSADAGSSAAAALVGKAIGATERDKADDVNREPTGDLAELVAAWRAAKQASPELAQRAAQLLSAGDGEQG